MRAIDADAMIDRLKEWNTKDKTDKALYNFTLNRINEQPTIQPEIIRCKDCKYARLTNDGSCKYCDIWFPDEAEYMDGDYYCASAERKSNG